MTEEKELNDMTEDELVNELASYYGGNPTQEEKYNIHSFLNKVATSEDTTKTGFLTVEELGQLPQTQRSYKELALISDKIMGNDVFKDYFAAEAEIVTSTSLSREGKLIDLAVVQKKQVQDITKTTQEKKGFFGKKKEPEEMRV